jgi:hypothetical protein
VLATRRTRLALEIDRHESGSSAGGNFRNLQNVPSRFWHYGRSDLHPRSFSLETPQLRFSDPQIYRLTPATAIFQPDKGDIDMLLRELKQPYYSSPQHLTYIQRSRHERQSSQEPDEETQDGLRSDTGDARLHDKDSVRPPRGGGVAQEEDESMQIDSGNQVRHLHFANQDRSLNISTGGRIPRNSDHFGFSFSQACHEQEHQF